MNFEPIKCLGQDIGSIEVIQLASDYSLNETYESPPNRLYLISRENGLSILFEDSRAIDLQIYIMPKAKNLAFTGELPFGIKTGMTQSQVHALAGPPDRFDEFDSIYMFKEQAIRLMIVFDDSSVAEYMSIRFTG